MEIRKMKHKFSFMLCPLTLLIHQSIYASPQINQLDTISVLGTSESKAEAGKDKMFSENQVTEYKSKKEIETYKGHSVADLLTGTTGVYSGDARNSGALDPNIRGVQGQGRIPVLVDGTEQAITVWRGFAGVSNRNYLDPFLISSVTVEKGPNLDRTLDSGAAGTIRLTTLEPDDIIKKGEKFGIEFKAETANNSIKQRGYPIPVGVDYRSLAHPEDVTAGEYSAYFKTSDRYPARSQGRNKFFKDNAYRLAVATKDEHFEGLVAYAYRSKGNYFSGGHGGHNYGEGMTIWDYDKTHNFGSNYTTDDPYIPWIATVYTPKKEVPNTSFESKSYLGKATFKFNDETKLKFGVRHSDMTYGEIMPSRLWQTGYQQGTVLQWPLANVKQTAVDTHFEYNPQNNRWINFAFGAYAVFNKAKTNTSGGSPADVLARDNDFNGRGLNISGKPAPCYPGEVCYDENYLRAVSEYMKKVQEEWRKYYTSNTKTPNLYGLFNTQEAQAQWAKDNHYGVNASNRFELHKKLNLDVMAAYKWEDLNSTNVYAQKLGDVKKVCNAGEGGFGHGSKEHNQVYCNSIDNYISGERMGKRKELNIGFNFQYNPVDWLILDAGAKYTHYKSRDDGLIKLLQDKMREDVKYGGEILLEVVKRHKITQEMVDEYNRYKKSREEYNKALEYYNKKEYEFIKAYRPNQPDYNDRKYCELEPDGTCDIDPDSGDFAHNDKYDEDFAIYRKKEKEYVENKLKENHITKPEEPKDVNIDPMTLDIIDNNKEKIETFSIKRNAYGKFDLESNQVAKQLIQDKLTEEQYNAYTGKMEKVIKRVNSEINKITPTLEQWEKMKKAQRTAHAWSPSFGITAFITDNIRLYARYTETKRMPSIFEDTIGYSLDAITPLYKRKPEHSKNIEVGYLHDLKGFLPNARRADVRLNYFHNLTKNIFDRDSNYTLQQFDKRILSGIEFQSRYDQGNLFATLGVVYNLKNKFCDNSFEIFNYHENQGVSKKIPYCVNGGNGSGYLKNTILPKYSITANLGLRFLDEKLELGSRWLYHSQVKDTRAKSLRKAGITWASGETNRWNPVLVVDAYINYRVNDNFTIELVGTNLTDRYYLDPITRSTMPAPGRTIKLGMTARF